MAFPMDDSKIQRHKGYGKEIFLIGAAVFVAGILLMILVWDHYSKGRIETDPVIIARNLIFFGSIFVGLIMMIIGYKKWPKQTRSSNEKKVLKIVGWSIFFIIIGTVVIAITYYSVECIQVKAGYETDLELARETYGFDTFEQWLELGATGKYLSNCVPYTN